MAGPLVVVAETVGPAIGRAGAKAGIQKLKDLLVSLGIWEGFQAAVDYAPDALEKMYTSLTDSGATPEKMAASKDKGKQVALMEIARQGIYLDESAGLTRSEAIGFQKAFKKFGHDMAAAVDARQAPRPVSEDPEAEKAAMLRAMHFACNRLGLSGPNRFRALYDIALIINSMKESDVQAAELHERYYGTIRT